MHQIRNVSNERSRPIRPRAPWWALATADALLASGCAAPPTPLPPISFTVDPSVVPSVAELPGFEDGVPRPLAAVANDDGSVADFVADEIWLTTDDAGELSAFLARWNGEVLATFVPGDYDLTGLSTGYLVRVDTAGADLDRLSDDLRALDATATGAHRVSSADGLDLLAVASREAAAGTDVGINWVGGGAQLRSRTTAEAPTGVGSAGGAYDQNAFTWASHSLLGAQEIGVGEAWRALDIAGRLGNRVKVAILDMGFQPDADTPTGWLAISNAPPLAPTGTSNALSCGSGNPCPWHGANVASAAMAVPNNGFGAAGPAGPVADAILVFTLYDFFTSITALGEARLLGARIANMSYSAPVPWYLAWSVLPFEAATFGFRLSGMLLFAAAGNDDRDVDAVGCTFGVCFERTWITPCENAGVICVGALAGGSSARASYSNYGAKQVDIFGPGTLWVGPDPDAPANQARAISGTSFASPFVAGVAALVWAADPSMSATTVENVLMSTAHPNGDPRVGRHVNAFGAVRQVLGNVPPEVTINGGGDVPFNLMAQLHADVVDVEDSFPCCTVVWSSNVDGQLGTGTGIVHLFTTMGSRVVTARATDSGGAVTEASVVVNVINVAPNVTLHAPTEAAVVFRTAVVQLRGSATDRNEPDETLACANLTWTSSVGSDPFPIVGCEVSATFTSNGARVLTLTGTDSLGASDAESVSITVVDPPPNLPPNVQVTSPQTGSSPPVHLPITLSGTANDPEGATPLTYQWTTKLGSNAPIVVGNAPSIEWTPNETYSFNQEGTYTVQVRLNVTDPGGNVGTD
ncbi:MAG: S8 family serine peptidase, partial [Trueperaceae bacterium]|nr:S8 family serine peptidase [Trueperaceae bacterium]